MIVYKTTCLLDAKFYVGQDANDDPTYLGSGLHLTRAIKKHGRDQFVKETLQRCESKQELNEAEQAWIEKLDAINSGYNIAAGGIGGRTRPEPWNKGLTKKTDARVKRGGKKVAAALQGHTQSEATRQKRSRSLRGRKQAPAVVAKRAEGLRGKSPSKKTRAHISATLRAQNKNAWLQLICTTCGRQFKRRASRERQREKEGRSGPYCGRSCATKGVKGSSPHGLYRYRKLGCRCDECRKAVRLDARRYRRKRRDE